jgi:hypothetical protein
LIIAILDVLGIAPDKLVSSVTLATLGLIAIGFLVTRYRIERIYRTTNAANSVCLLKESPPTQQNDLKHAKEIWLLGLTLRDVTYNNYYTFKQRAAEGLKIRALLANPDRVDLDAISKRFGREATGEQFREQYKQTFEQYKKISEAASNADCIQVRLISFIPSFGLFIFPKAEADRTGIIYVQTYGYKPTSGSIPKYKITEWKNPYWYEYFISQFEVMWDDADAYPLRTTS